MESFLNYAKERLKEAENQINELEKMIEIGKKAGLNISEYIIKLQNLKNEYNRWKKAIEGL